MITLSGCPVVAGLCASLQSLQHYSVTDYMVTSLQHSLILLTSALTHHFLVDVSKLSYDYPISVLHHYNPTLSLVPGDTTLLHYIIVGSPCFSIMLSLCHKITLAHFN